MTNPTEHDPLCEFADCRNSGWAVLHFGRTVPPSLRVACRAHLSETDLADFRDDAAKDVPLRCCCGPHAIAFGEVPDPGCPAHGGERPAGGGGQGPRCGECRLGLGVHNPDDPLCEARISPPAKPDDGAA